MRIALFLPSLSKTGPGIVVRDLCTEYIEKGHYCKVFYFNDIVDMEFPCETQLIKFFEKIPFDQFNVIHTHMVICDVYIKFHRNRIPKDVNLISTLHQPISFAKLKLSFGWVKAKMLSWLWNVSLKSFNKVIVLNDDTYKELPYELRETAKVIFNGRRFCNSSSEPVEIAKLVKSLKSNYKIIGTVSSIDYRKNIEQIVYALPILTEYALVIVGIGPSLKELEKLSAKLGVSDRVLFLGFQNNTGWIYPYFDIFAMCSRSEGFPLSLIEAASYGIPTVLSDIPIFKSIVKDEIVCFCKLDSPESFAEQVKIIEQNPLKFGSLLKEYYQAYLTSNVMAENYLNLYKSL